MGKYIGEVTDANLKTLQEAYKRPLLVALWAARGPWWTEKRVQAAADNHADVDFGRALWKTCKKMREDLGVEGAPRVLLFRGEKLVDMEIGEMTEAMLEYFLRKNGVQA